MCQVLIVDFSRRNLGIQYWFVGKVDFLLNLELAVDHAKEFVYLMLENAYVKQIEIAGSVRRQKQEVNDIEIVVEPRNDVFGHDVHGAITMLTQKGILEPRPTPSGRKPPYGLKHYRIDYKISEGALPVPVDLFVVLPPADWGVIYAIRTGNQYYSKYLVTEALKKDMRVDEGRLVTDVLVSFGKPTHIPCPTEKDFFKALEIDWIEPKEREMKG